jgi:methylglyoxal synthase
MKLPNSKKRIALVAHDHKKNDLLNWAKIHLQKLQPHHLFATGTTGSLLEKELGIKITKFKSGPLGGDQQIGALISEREIDMLIFFWDPLEPLPHDPDVKALLRLATLWNIPVACNLATADFLLSSDNFENGYEPTLPDLSNHLNRKIPN